MNTLDSLSALPLLLFSVLAVALAASIAVALVRLVRQDCATSPPSGSTRNWNADGLPSVPYASPMVFNRDHKTPHN